MSLSSAQQAAARRLDQDVCVVAGPGSGKTSVLIQRFAWLVREQGVAPSAVLAITFTERAANEIKERLVREFENEPELRENIERAYVSTIHGFCARLLREHAIDAGIDPQFSIVEAQDAKRLLRQCTEAALQGLYETKTHTFRSLLRGVMATAFMESTDLASILIELYEKVRLSGLDTGTIQFREETSGAGAKLRDVLRDILDEPLGNPPFDKKLEHDRYREWARALLDCAPGTIEYLRALDMPKFDKRKLSNRSAAHRYRDELKDNLVDAARAEALLAHYAAERALLIDALREMHRRYSEEKRSRSLLDFSDLEFQALSLLYVNDEIREGIRNRFDFILMDELQDTNPLQWQLVKALRSPGAFFGVGDANQSIYQFRHANPALFHDYRQSLLEQGLAVDELRENYRSRPELMDAVNRIFASGAPGIDPHTLEAKLAYPSKHEPSVELIAAFDNGATPASDIESAWVARRIAELAGTLQLTEPGKERIASFKDFAILARTNKALDEYQRELDRFGIPSILLGGVSFFEAREVKDILALLRLFANPHGDIALAAVLRSPMAGISDETLFRLRLAAGSNQPLSHALAALPPDIDSEQRRVLSIVWRTYQKAREALPLIGPERAVRMLLDQSNYEGSLPDRKRSNIEKLLVRIRARWPEANGSLHALVADLQSSEPEPEAPPIEAADAVKLLTVHGSKGLEFPVVLLPGLHRDGNSTPDALAFEPPDTLGISWRDPVKNGSASDPFHLELKAVEKERRKEEDDRLFYVALTRAREHLILSFDATKSRGWSKLMIPGLGLTIGSKSIPDNQVRIERGLSLLLTDQMPEMLSLDAGVSTPPFEYLPRPVGREPWDSTASVTSVSLFETSPREYLLSRFVRWQALDAELPTPPPDGDLPEIDASEFGQQVHSLLAGVEAPHAVPEASALATRFRESKLGRAAAAATRAEREWDFLMEIDGIVLRGQIDLWFESCGQVTIVDYKTDRVPHPLPGAYPAYELQLQIYALALGQALSVDVKEAWLYFLRPDAMLPVDLSPIALGAARESVARFKKAHAAWSFPQTSGS